MEEGKSMAPKTTTLRFDVFAIISIAGFLKVFQLILNFCGLICIVTGGDYATTPRSTFYSFTSGTGLCVTGILLIVYAFHIAEKFSSIPWLKFELVYCVLWVIFHFTAGMLTIGLINANYNIAGWFAFIALGMYGIDALYKILLIKTGKPAQ